MAGLFSTPDEIALQQQQLLENQAQGAAKSDPWMLGNYYGTRAGQQLGGLFTGPSAAMRRAQAVQDAVAEANSSGLDIGTPGYFSDLTSRLQKRGLSNEAFSLMDYS